MQSMAFTIKHQLKVQRSMDELEERLRQLVAETCRHLPGSTERQKGLTQIIRVITNSGRFCRDNASYIEKFLSATVHATLT
jgi:regulator of sirC expression with transglutaminase-like and TPR domain